MNAAQAFIAFLRCEASQAEERAKSLRATAATIEANAHEGKKKKRKREPAKQKRAHTAYTLFVHENYEMIKKNHGEEMQSKDIISLVARQWAQTSEEEKEIWRYRADQLKDSGAVTAVAEEIEEVGLPEPPIAEDGGVKKRAYTKRA